MGDFFSLHGLKVQANAELFRVRDIPRRVWELDAENLAGELSDILRAPGGTMQLRPVQAAALYEIGTVGGFFGPLRVGAGKTLITLLAGRVAFAKRPLLLVPASLIEKTRRDAEAMGEHWEFDLPRMFSYEWLGRAQAAEALANFAPDLIIADEAHKLKNPRAAVTRRVKRYMHQNPQTKFCAMSGTITKRSLHDYAHLLFWTHENPPIPTRYTDLERWADALDERKGQTRRAHPGALRELCDPFELAIFERDARQGARLAFRRRLTETPGVVATSETPIDASIRVRAVEPPPSRGIEDAFDNLRRNWETPDGWPISDALGMFRHARELALGFYYVWDPRPPRHWLEARKAWARFVRGVLSRSRKLDSELQVRREHADAPECKEWIAVRDEFKPNTVPQWIDDSAVEFCAGFEGIIWTEHTHFAERLAKVSGLPYYGRKGQDHNGRAIEDHKPGAPMIASISSNGTGRNLQAWANNLIASMPANGLQVEQLMGRTHRDGQTADEVCFDILINCAEHVGAYHQSIADCQYTLDTTGSPQKILLADRDVPSLTTFALRNGARWTQ